MRSLVAVQPVIWLPAPQPFEHVLEQVCVVKPVRFVAWYFPELHAEHTVSAVVVQPVICCPGGQPKEHLVHEEEPAMLL